MESNVVSAMNDFHTMRLVVSISKWQSEARVRELEKVSETVRKTAI